MSEKIKVLIVDDDNLFATSFSDILLERNMETTVVNSGKEAIEMVKQTDFDVILMDIIMPIMNGVETYREIKKIF